MKNIIITILFVLLSLFGIFGGAYFITELFKYTDNLLILTITTVLFMMTLCGALVYTYALKQYYK